jgi:hypothetical protein
MDLSRLAAWVREGEAGGDSLKAGEAKNETRFSSSTSDFWLAPFNPWIWMMTWVSASRTVMEKYDDWETWKVDIHRTVTRLVQVLQIGTAERLELFARVRPRLEHDDGRGRGRVGAGTCLSTNAAAMVVN